MGDYEGDYAILSHTWEKDEITFQEMLTASESSDLTLVQQIKSKAGYLKVRQAAQIAAFDGYEYVWVDTCCIDKTSSAELSEAINSMFRWYRGASSCYVYLADVRQAYPRVSGAGKQPWGFSSSRWFTRGWTLQELIAPRHLKFYSQDWIWGSTKSDILADLSRITGVSERVLETGDPSQESIASRMSWSANRSTTRVEDLAYCLLGLFDVNMPLLYGEGEKAFLRLQEEIARRSDDQTLFCWKHRLGKSEEKSSYALYRGLFARSPKEFDKPGAELHYVPLDRFHRPSSMTNVGFRVKLPLIPVVDAKSLGLLSEAACDDGDCYSADEFLAPLSCHITTVVFLSDQKHANSVSPTPAILLKQLVAHEPIYV